MPSCTDFVPQRDHFPVSQRKEVIPGISFIGDILLYNNSEDMSLACVM